MVVLFVYQRVVLKINLFMTYYTYVWSVYYHTYVHTR